MIIKKNIFYFALRSICTIFDFESKIGGISAMKTKKNIFYFALRSICTIFAK